MCTCLPQSCNPSCLSFVHESILNLNFFLFSLEQPHCAKGLLFLPRPDLPTFTGRSFNEVYLTGNIQDASGLDHRRLRRSGQMGGPLQIRSKSLGTGSVVGVSSRKHRFITKDSALVPCCWPWNTSKHRYVVMCRSVNQWTWFRGSERGFAVHSWPLEKSAKYRF